MFGKKIDINTVTKEDLDTEVWGSWGSETVLDLLSQSKKGRKKLKSLGVEPVEGSVGIIWITLYLITFGLMGLLISQIF